MIVTPIQSGSVGWLGTVNSNFQAIDAATQMKSAVVVQYIQADTPTSPTHGDFWLDTSGTSQLLKVCVNASWVLLYQVVVGTIIVCDNEFWRITSTSDRERIPSLNFYSQGLGKTYFCTVDFTSLSWCTVKDYYTGENLVLPNDTTVYGEALCISQGYYSSRSTVFYCAATAEVYFPVYTYDPYLYGESDGGWRTDMIKAVLFSVSGGCEMRFQVGILEPNSRAFLVVTLHTYFSQG